MNSDSAENVSVRDLTMLVWTAAAGLGACGEDREMLSRFTEWRGQKDSRAIRARFKLALVGRVSLFAGLSKREVGLIANLINEAEFPAGTQLVKAGEPGTEMFIIVSGDAVVRTKGGRTVRLKPGDFFGEMSVIDGAPRAATVEASTPIRVLVLGQRDFWRVLDGSKAIVRKIMRTLCERLRETDKSASE